MTFSILAHDGTTGAFGGAAATGNLCVGGWVMRGDARAGMSASQGTYPSTLWGTDTLAMMQAGRGAQAAVEAVTAADPGRDHRQLAALDREAGVAAFTGARSVPHAGAVMAGGVVVAGNMLDGPDVLPAILGAFTRATGPLAERLMAALRAGAGAGGDSRGLLSAALLVVAPDRAPLDLRIDHSQTPLADLEALYARTRAEPYASWLRQLPTLHAPYRDGNDAGATESPRTPSDGASPPDRNA